MCLAQGHNAVMPVRLEPATPRSRVKHSTTEPIPESDLGFNYMYFSALHFTHLVILKLGQIDLLYSWSKFGELRCNKLKSKYGN